MYFMGLDLEYDESLVKDVNNYVLSKDKHTPGSQYILTLDIINSISSVVDNIISSEFTFPNHMYERLLEKV